MNRIDVDRKKIILICIFLAIFILGTVFIFIIPFDVKATYNKTVKTIDGETISFNVFEPKRTGVNKKAIILGHGIKVMQSNLLRLVLLLFHSIFGDMD